MKHKHANIYNSHSQPSTQASRKTTRAIAVIHHSSSYSSPTHPNQTNQRTRNGGLEEEDHQELGGEGQAFTTRSSKPSLQHKHFI
jgi:hypothetical protein